MFAVRGCGPDLPLTFPSKDGEPPNAHGYGFIGTLPATSLVGAHITAEAQDMRNPLGGTSLKLRSVN